jgi:hypothetical protein
VRASHDATHVKKMELSETIGVTLKDDVWCWATDLMVVAEVVCGISSSCVFLRTLYPCLETTSLSAVLCN